VLPDTSPVPAKKSTAGSVKRGPYKQQEEVKRPRITIDDDDDNGDDDDGKAKEGFHSSVSKRS